MTTSLEGLQGKNGVVAKEEALGNHEIGYSKEPAGKPALANLTGQER